MDNMDPSKNAKVNDHIQSSHLVNDLEFYLKFRISIHIDFAQESAFWPGTYRKIKTLS